MESAFDDEALEKIRPVVQSEKGECSFDIGRLFIKCSAVAFTGSIKLATNDSHYQHCSKVLIGDKLVEINFFAQCNVCCDEGKVEKYWLVNCTAYLEHQCRCWYGNPTQVWSNDLTSSGSRYYLIKDIKNRVVYVNTQVNFGRHIGEDSVLIVAPIPLT